VAAAGDGSTGGGRGRGLGIGTIAAALMVIWGATGVYQVDAAERAVITRFGRYVRTTQPGIGMHIPWPIESRRIVNIGSMRLSTIRRGCLRWMRTSSTSTSPCSTGAPTRSRSSSTCATRRDAQEVCESAIREIIGRSRLDFVLEDGRRRSRRPRSSCSARSILQDGHRGHLVNLQWRQRSRAGAELAARRDQGARGQGAAGLEAQAYSNDILPKAKGSAAAAEEDAMRTRRGSSPTRTARHSGSKLLAAYERARA
jgi:membrane protease subunit HflK